MTPHPFDAERGLNGSSDLFSPGFFTLRLRGGETVTIGAEVAAGAAAAADGGKLPAPAAPAAAGESRPDDEAPDALPLPDALRRAIRDFIVRRDGGLAVLAGYPWFLDWGRDTLICLRGIIAAGLLAEARRIVAQFAAFERDGTLPNLIRGDDASNRDTADTPLWLFVACADLARAENSPAVLDLDCGGRPVRAILRAIAEAYRAGTPNGIRMDPATGLVFSPAHFTWMDTNHPAGTPRQGYPIEIQALWHRALEFMGQLEPAGPWAALAGQVRRSIETLYARPDLGYLADCLHADPGQSAVKAAADDALRPNQLLAITLGAVADRSLAAAVLRACEELLTPGAIRSLADRPVAHPLPVLHNGRPLNDPLRPYWGAYGGDEDTRRKPAYHNGTAWTWLFPSYGEALLLRYGGPARPKVRALLASSVALLNRGCVGHVPEIVDGDAPHAPRGCGAQAWSATELYRVLSLAG
jgi:predicted glycogen debranching enzyme